MLTQLRKDGRALGAELERLRRDDPIVIAIPRRGIVVGAEVARVLDAPLEVVLATKVGEDDGGGPIGAVALGGLPVRAPRASGLDDERLAELFDRAHRALEARLAAIRADAPLPELRDRTVILVDDAVVSGLTITAAIDALVRRKVRAIVVATPLASIEAAARVMPSVRGWVALAEAAEDEAEARHLRASNAICPPIADEEIRDLLLDAWHVESPQLGPLEIDGI